MSFNEALALETIVAEVAAQFATNGVTAAVRLGKDFVAQRREGAEVVFVPTRDTYAPPKRAGSNPRPLYTRKVGAQVHIWAAAPAQANADLQAAANLATAAALVRGTVVALRRTCTDPTLELGGGEWLNESKTVTYGAEYVLEVALLEQVFDVIVPAVAPPFTSIHHGYMHFPTGDVDAC